MTTADAERVTRAIRYLEQHSRVQPSLEAVAAAAGLSPYHFQRLFRRWAGVSPKRFLQFLTIGSARQALREGRSVLESAYDAGLSGPGRLHDLFVTFDAVTPGEFKSRGTGMVIDYGFVDTPFGDGFLALTERGICGLAFLDAGQRREALADFRANWPGAVLRRAPLRAADTARRIFRPGGAVERLMLDLRGTNFQIKVWEALLRIPPGSLVSYGDLAGAVGQPRAHRAVASAVARNPVAFLIPCHRVIRQSGRFGEYRWGTERKQAMIGWEAAQRETAHS
jgi:AraC family transcriptional regulator of adaptative response/methylated-DNA-[protein]-cysteine methyltransferase